MSQHIFGEANMEVQLHVNRSFTGKVRDTHEHKRDSSVQPRHGGSLGTITWVQLPVGTGQRVGSDIYPETEQVRSLSFIAQEHTAGTLSVLRQLLHCLCRFCNISVEDNIVRLCIMADALHLVRVNLAGLDHIRPY